MNLMIVAGWGRGSTVMGKKERKEERKEGRKRTEKWSFESLFTAQLSSLDLVIG